MEWPSVAPAPIVTAPAGVGRDRFANQGPVRPGQHDLTGRLVRPHKRVANRGRCLLASADNTHLSRFLSEAPWREPEVNRRRSRVLRPQTTRHRRRRRDSLVVIAETRCAHVGSLVDPGDRPDHHGDGPSPLAPHPVTSFSVSGPVRFPLGLRLSRRDDAGTPGAAAVAPHVPELKRPPDTKARHRLQQPVDPVRRQAPEVRARQAPLQPTMALASALVEAAIRPQGPCGVVVFDAWSLAADGGRGVARRRTDWISLLTQNRRRETASVHVRDAKGWPRQRPSPHLAVEALGPLSPAKAYRPVTVPEPTSGGFTRAVRLPGLGQVRRVGSCAQESLTGRAVVLVTNRGDWNAAQSMALSVPRWPTATLSQDATGPLGGDA